MSDMPTRAEFREEVLLVHKIITHPAGYDLGLFGGLLSIRSTDQETFEVESEGIKVTWIRNRSFKSSLRAAATFVYLRHKWGIGIDHDIKAIQKQLDTDRANNSG